MNNSDSVLKKIANLYAEQLMSDIILLVGEKEYPAHRVILCASSDVFQVMLMNPHWNECRKRVIELVEEPCCEVVFPQFLQYLYVGKIKIALNTVMPLLVLGHKYNVQDLVSLCVDYMMKHIAKAATQGFLISWLQYTIAFSPQHYELTEALKRFLKWNLEMVADAKDFGEMEEAVMILLLQQNDLVVSSEYQLFNILQNWLFQRKEKIDTNDELSETEKEINFRELIEQTIKHIRFGMMTPRELAHLLIFPLIIHHSEFIVERMAIGMSYQSGQEDRVCEVRNSSAGRLQFTPRLYLNDTWSIGIEVNDLNQLDNYNYYVNCFFSQGYIAENEDGWYKYFIKININNNDSSIKYIVDQPITWEIEFYPKGIKFGRAKMVWGEDVPEVSLNTVRLRVTCRYPEIDEQRFKVGFTNI